VGKKKEKMELKLWLLCEWPFLFKASIEVALSSIAFLHL
jgi:hypothetical protein